MDVRRGGVVYLHGLQSDRGELKSAKLRGRFDNGQASIGPGGIEIKQGFGGRGGAALLQSDRGELKFGEGDEGDEGFHSFNRTGGN